MPSTPNIPNEVMPKANQTIQFRTGGRFMRKEQKNNKIWIYALITGLVILSVVFVAQALNTTQATNIQKIDATQTSIQSTGFETKVKLSVSIPCSGHAQLIKDELYKLEGLSNIVYQPTNTFIVSYDPAKTSQEEILGLSIFKEYPAKIIG